ncbi:MAG: 50S ribosomal protein L19 [candidate division WOR-3 bacterium]
MAEKTEKREIKIQKEPFPKFKPGDIIKVYHKIFEGDKERIQTFQGTVIQIRGSKDSKTFTVRKISRGIGVERIFPLNSPLITKIELKKSTKVRRAKLYFLRTKKGSAVKLKEQRIPTAVEAPVANETM